MLVLFLLIFIVVFYLVHLKKTKEQYEKFVYEHSIALKKLGEINKKYEFHKIPSFNMENDYDNEDFYDTISPKDYLTYQLVYIRKDVLKAISNTAENKRLYSVYKDVIKNSCVLGQYDTTELPTNEEELRKIEDRLFRSYIKNPRIDFSISVYLENTKINGVPLTSKSKSFKVEEIEDIINRLSHKRGDFYLDNEIWQSICRVERGKVSNKMRFAIYERDGYRCRKCGKYTEDLEIDHIFPISKGGKSNYDNLQTLCHRCNSLKSNIIEAGAKAPNTRKRSTNELCPNCGINLVIKDGRYGDFYACPNYPKCRYTKQINKGRN
jgi:ssDNA-binding Zn-finger/Zn-ribbon topoisomerase 1